MLTDNQGEPLAELRNAHSRNLYLPLGRINTGSFVIDNLNPYVKLCQQIDLTFVKAYRETGELGKVLMSNGPLVPAYQKSVSDSQRQITVNFAGIGWRLARRIIEETKSVAGYTFGWPSPMDRGAMVAQIINSLNNAPVPDSRIPQAFMDTGIRVGSIVGGLPAQYTTVGPWNYQNALQGILEICSTLDAPEWVIVPIEALNDGGPGVVFGELAIQPTFGGVRPNCVWEYGDGKHNVVSFNQTGDGTVLMNRGYSLPSGFPSSTTDTSGAGVLSNYDLASILGRRVLYEDIVTADLTTSVTRQAIIDQALSIQKQPKIVITFQPSVDETPGVVPQYGVDYGLGDVVQFRAVENGVETVNALFRIYGITFAIDDEGLETPTPVLISQDV